MKLFDTVWNQNIPEILPVVPTIDVVAFPHMIIPLLIVDEKIIAGVQKAIDSGNKLILIVACKKSETLSYKSIGSEDIYSVGTIANVIRLIPLQEGGAKILIQGITRAKVSDIKIDDILTAKISVLKYQDSEENKGLLHEKILFLKSLVETLVQNNSISSDFSNILMKMTQPEKIADFIISHLTLSTNELQRLLEVNTYIQFFDIASEYLIKEAEIIKIQQKVKNKARESMNNAQKEFYIREQIKALKDEIGEDSSESDNLRQKLYTIEEYLSPESFKELFGYINKLEGMAAESAEAGVLKSYLECVFDLPWDIETEDNDDIFEAKKILDEDHFGLESIKERILDFLSVKILSKETAPTVLCFFGPPGVGKTSFAKSIAKALGRKYFRIAAGGMKDESEIRGHRRTYVGAMPGRFIKGMRQVETKNPVIIIDEIDKIGNEFRGDPSAALLEILDYQQNKEFHDHYLGIPFDLSKSFFITTANNLDTIPAPLRDRMELIELTAYSFEEKRKIASKYLVKKGLKEAGLEKKNIEISQEIIDKIILEYTYEAGVRDLERWIKKLCFRIARILVETKSIEIPTLYNLEKYLGYARYTQNDLKEGNKIGVSSGLCWTSCGGEVINIETVISRGQGKLILTGRLGEVMKESAQTALSYIKYNCSKFKLDDKIFSENDIHLHVPAGGTPKDGPSAGGAILVSILSALKRFYINNDCAMTGEIDLQGHILPVGGIKEKVLAAKRNNIKNVFIPIKNKSDVLEIKYLVEEMNIKYVSNIDEILNVIFEKEKEASDFLLTGKDILEEIKNEIIINDSIEDCQII
jgi:ATP-dependent Lon protease